MQTLTVADIGEHALIARITATSRRSLGGGGMPSWVVIGPGDDAAVIEPMRGAFDVLTTDALVDGVHFDQRFVPPEAIGHRALAVNLSDLAAMGAVPRAALLSLALPPSLNVSAFDRMLDGLLGLAATHHVALVGGNITQTPGPMTLDVTAIGAVRPRRLMTRAGARPGEEVYVTGRLGDAAVGLERLRQASKAGSAPDGAVERYLKPEPRVRAGMLLASNRAATSCMDVSDGLADCIRQVAGASGVGMVVDASAIPMSSDTRGFLERVGRDPLETALSGGDDYELFFTSRPAHRGRLRAVCQHLGHLPITKIGVVTKARDILVRDAHGTRTLPAGYEHFR